MRHGLRLPILVILVGSAVTGEKPVFPPSIDEYLSSMGALARARIQAGIALRALRPSGDCADGNIRCIPYDELLRRLDGTQSEVSIAVDSTGLNIVVGFNDFRGFNRNPISSSGYMHSHDGGVTFIDGGQLPSPGNQALPDGTRFPQIFGDPDVKYLGGCNFIYSSLITKVTGAAGQVGTIGIHRSRDCGRTWQGPIEVPPATNPGGRVDVGENATDFADKELMAVDPDTGRVMLGWTNFTQTTGTPAVPFQEMSVTFTDNILSANPTFAPRRVIFSGSATGAAVEFAGAGSSNAYMAFRVYTSGVTRRIAVCRSTDNAVTWSPCIPTSLSFVAMDEVLGNDRINENPSLAADASNGPFKGALYTVYSNNNLLDGADVAFQKSTDGGLTFSPPILLNSRPGRDRAQWFPFVSVDRLTGRIYVFYYDQGIDTSGDLTEVSFLSSDDGGVTWTQPAPLSDRPFKAGWGNGTSQPNLGDYNQSVAQMATFFAAYATTRQVRFTEGQPTTQFPTPDVSFNRVPGPASRTGLRLGAVTFTDSGGNGAIDAGDRVNLQLPLSNPSLNPLHAAAITGVTATLTSTTAGVTVVQPASGYPNVASGGTAANAVNFVLQVSPAFVPGTPIELTLNVASSTGMAALRHTLSTGTLLETVLLSENFESVPPGALPAGWAAVHGAGANIVPWVTSNTFCGASNKAFHPNANDGPPGGSPSRWERLFSPVVDIPPDSREVVVEFDACYDTEDAPPPASPFRILAFDGFFLRVTDQTPGRTLRSVLAEAFEQEFTTGPLKHYPKHFPRNSDPNYVEDMSVWAGESGGPQHVRMTLPGMAGSRVNFRFEYAQDSNSTCADVRPGHTCGVSIDNFVVKATRLVVPTAVNLIVRSSLARDAPTGQIVATVTVMNEGSAPAANVRFTSAILGSTATATTLPVLGSIAPGASAVVELRFPAGAASPGAPSLLRIAGSYAGGAFGGTTRVTAP
jgi:hypothetical protein